MGPVLSCLSSGFGSFFHFLLPCSTLIHNQAALGQMISILHPNETAAPPIHFPSHRTATKRETLHQKQLRKHLGFFPLISPSQQDSTQNDCPHFTNEEAEQLSRNLPAVTPARAELGSDCQWGLPVWVSFPHHSSLVIVHSNCNCPLLFQYNLCPSFPSILNLNE